MMSTRAGELVPGEAYDMLGHQSAESDEVLDACAVLVLLAA
jgi:hypothetical protein